MTSASVEPMDRHEWDNLPLWKRLAGHIYWSIVLREVTWLKS